VKVYIAGPMATMPNMNFPTFGKVANHLRDGGHAVANPADFPDTGPMSRADYMKRDLPVLLTMDAIVMLPGWADAKGACIELATAIAAGLKVYEWRNGINRAYPMPIGPKESLAALYGYRLHLMDLHAEAVPL